MANGGHLFRPEDKDELDFSEPPMLFYARVDHVNDMEYNYSLPPYSSALIHVHPLMSTSFRMSSALRASALSLGSLIGYISSTRCYIKPETVVCLPDIYRNICARGADKDSGVWMARVSQKQMELVRSDDRCSKSYRAGSSKRQRIVNSPHFSIGWFSCLIQLRTLAFPEAFLRLHSTSFYAKSRLLVYLKIEDKCTPAIDLPAVNYTN